MIESASLSNEPAGGTGKTALITGASTGIGYELSVLFAADRYGVVLAARHETKLAEVAGELQRRFGVTARYVAVDLSSAEGPRLLFDRLREENIAIDVLVNNAAFGKLGDFMDVPLEDSIGQVQLNAAALTALTKLFLEQILDRKGKILNVASTAGFQPGPHMAVYYATKAYVISFSEALASELKDRGVTVTCLCPGPTTTAFQSRAGMEDAALFRTLRPMDAATVARAGYRALMAGRTLAIPGLRNLLLAKAVRFSPRALVIALSRRFLER